MALLSKYKNILGEPGKGFHRHFSFGFAILDLIATIILALVITKYKYGKITFSKFGIVFLVLMVIAIFLHAIFGVKTVLNKKLGIA